MLDVIDWDGGFFYNDFLEDTEPDNDFYNLNQYHHNKGTSKYIHGLHIHKIVLGQ